MNRRSIVLAACLLALLSPGLLVAQISRLTLDASYAYSDFSRGDDQTRGSQRLYAQLYTLGLQGFAFDPKLMTFSVKSGLQDEVSRYRVHDATSTERRRELQLYDVNLMLFPGNSFPITFYGIRGANTITASWDRAQGNTSQASKTSRDATGANIRMKANTYWPDVGAGVDKSTLRGNSLLTPFDQTSRSLYLNMANTNGDNVSGYAFAYQSSASEYTPNAFARAAGIEASLYRPPSRTRLITAQTTTRLWDALDLRSEVRNDSRDSYEDRNAQAILGFNTGRDVRHSSRVTMSNADFLGLTSTGYHVRHDVDLGAGGGTRGQLNAELVSNKNAGPLSSSVYERATIGGGWTTGVGSPNTISAEGTLEASMGRERLSAREPMLIHRLASMLTGTVSLFDGGYVAIADNAAHQRQLTIGRTFENEVRLTFGIGQRAWSATVEARRMDQWYPDLGLFPKIEASGISGRATVSLGTTTSAQVKMEYEVRRLGATDVGTTMSATLRNRGLIRNLTVAFDASYARHSLARARIVRLNAGVTYRFYAYALAAGYVYESFSRYRSNGFSLAIQRQFSFDML